MSPTPLASSLNLDRGLPIAIAMAGNAGGQGQPMGKKERLPLFLAVVGFGFATWLAFLMRASRQQSPRWLVVGLLYLAALIAAMLLDPGVSDSPQDRNAGAVVFILWLVCWVGGVIHLFKTRPSVLGAAEERVAEPSERTAAADLKKLDSRRVGARLIDEALIFGASIGLGLMFDTLTVGIALFFLWASVVYFFVCELTVGQTLGKKLLGLRVMKRDGTPPGAAAIAGRNIVRLIEEPFLALIALVATRKRRQRIGDLIAGTTVGRAEGSHRPAPSPWRVAYPAIWAACAVGYVLVLGLPVNKSVAEVMSEDERTAFVSQIEQLCEEHDAAIHESQPLSASELLDQEAGLVDAMTEIDHPQSLEYAHRYAVSLNILVRDRVYGVLNATFTHDRRLAMVQRQRLRRAYAVRASEFARGGIECDIEPPAIGAGGGAGNAGVHMLGS